MDFFELDFQNVEADKSGDAICLRYQILGQTYIHVVDGGYQSTGDRVANHIRKYYGNPTRIDHVVATHNDGDHAGGLRVILEEFEIGALWMLRPWIYAPDIIDSFSYYTNSNSLAAHLREVYSNLAALEEIALRRGIPIYEPFQGALIGAFKVMAPKRERFLNLIVSSEKTPQALKQETALQSFGKALLEAAQSAKEYVNSLWGVEIFPTGETSAENEMSVVQFAELCGRKILLTADTGRNGLNEFISYAPNIGLVLPGIDRFQVPHHGARRNVSSDLLDKILGPKLNSRSEVNRFSAIISSAKSDKDHPRRSVIRAMIHRGGQVFTTENADFQSHENAPARGWGSATALAYPDDQEEL